ncbi:MAG: hypothetical protein K9G58_03750 [Bacteroidales bacterium]|nr:hypothetical protein [Bacteroidales bacterium]MCF8386736.1 hypothetical protein [Bacteroidales bacterium]MCF8397258.1 hypothetical protein [Bacteroidales bacterium]
MPKHHYLSIDFRRESLTHILYSLEYGIQSLRLFNKEFKYYDGLWLLEESEPMFGLAFIALQNYVNGSIYDRYRDLKEQNLFYKEGRIVKDSGRTDIELIVALANYYKHRDHPNELFEATRSVLDDFDFRYDKFDDITMSPLIKGIELFSNTWSLPAMIEVVSTWRKSLWDNSS